LASVISIVGFFAAGFAYLRFDAAYLAGNPMAFAGFPGGNPAALPSGRTLASRASTCGRR